MDLGKLISTYSPIRFAADIVDTLVFVYSCFPWWELGSCSLVFLVGSWFWFFLFAFAGEGGRVFASGGLKGKGTGGECYVTMDGRTQSGLLRGGGAVGGRNEREMLHLQNVNVHA